MPLSSRVEDAIALAPWLYRAMRPQGRSFLMAADVLLLEVLLFGTIGAYDQSVAECAARHAEKKTEQSTRCDEPDPLKPLVRPDR